LLVDFATFPNKLVEMLELTMGIDEDETVCFVNELEIRNV
jgi:hypothetical protein